MTTLAARQTVPGLLAAAHDEIEQRHVHIARLVQDGIGDVHGVAARAAHFQDGRQPQGIVAAHDAEGRPLPDHEFHDELGER